MNHKTLLNIFCETIYKVCKIQPVALIMSEYIIRYIEKEKIKEIHSIFLCNAPKTMDYVVLSVYSIEEQIEYLFRFNKVDTKLQVFLRRKNFIKWQDEIDITETKMIFKLREQ